MSINYNQQLLQAASLTAKTALLKKGLKNSNEAVKGFMKKMSSVTKSESDSDAEEILPTSQFSPLASSTQQVKKSDSTSEDSDEAESTNRRMSSKDSGIDKSEKIKKSPSVNIISNTKIKESASSSDSSDPEVNDSKSTKKLLRNREDIKRMLSLKKNENTANTNANSKSSESDSSSSSGSSTKNSKTEKNTPLESRKHQGIKQNEQNSKSEDESSSSTSEDNTKVQGKNKIHISNQASPVQKSLSQSRYNELCDSDSDEPQNSSKIYSRGATSNSYQQVSKTPVENLKKFLEETPGYERTKIGDKADISGIDSDDEVYLLRIPKTVDPRSLQGLSFSLSKKSKIRTESGKYVINEESDSPAPLLVYSNTLKRISPLRTFKMEKYLKTEEQGEIVIEEKKKQPLPENIKVRHPLFGADYESKIQLEEQIKEKLQQALQRFHVRKKTKKKKREVKEEDVEDKSLLISKILEKRFSSVKQSQSSNCSGESGMEINEKKKKKKKRHSTDETDVSGQIGNLSMNSKVKKKQKSGFEIDQIISIKQEVESQDESVGNERKKKKKNRNNGIIAEASPNTTENENTKRKKSMKFEPNKHEILKTSIKQEIQTEVETQDESDVGTTKRKKKKKKDKTELSLNGLKSDVDETVVSKKKKHDFLIPNMKTEVESQDEGASLETPSKNKKKSKNFVPEISIKKEPDESISRKKRRKSMLNSTEIVGDVSTINFKFDVSNIEREEPVSKKSKKTKGKNDDLINSLLSNVRNRLDSGSEEKAQKRKKVS